MTKILAILSGIMLIVVFLFWSLVAVALIERPHHEEQWEAILTLLVVGSFLLASGVYLISSFRRLTPPEELGADLLDTQSLRTQPASLSRLQKTCGIVQALGGVALLLFFVGLVLHEPPPFNDYEDIFAFITLASLVLLFFVVQVSYVYRSWRTIGRHVAQYREGNDS